MCVRIRMTFGNGGEDYTGRAWEMDRVGIWYGSWLPDDLYGAYGDPNVRPVIASSMALNLNEIMEARGSSCAISESGANTARRFDDLLSGSWVFVYFDRTLHFAQIANDGLFCEPEMFQVGEELFKYKRIHNKKSFRLSELPDPFMLLAPAGRSNVYRVGSCEGLVELLQSSRDSTEVRQKFSEMEWDQWLKALGPRGWESLCTGYLILAHGYLPSGLAVGGTLADFDIVGSLESGKAVFAQCKNDRGKRRISAADAEVFHQLEAAECFYFAYGGVDRTIPNVNHLSGRDITAWLDNDPKGQSYKRRLRSS